MIAEPSLATRLFLLRNRANRTILMIVETSGHIRHKTLHNLAA